MKDQGTELFPPGIALVVGGSGGIGRAAAAALGEAGADVALTWRSQEEPALKAAEELQAIGRKAEAIHMPLSQPGKINAALERLAAEHGQVHTVVCAAGAAIGQPYVSAADPVEFQRVITEDLGGFFNLVHAALPFLRSAGESSIVAVTSAGLGRFPPGDILSVAPKGGVEAIVKGVAREEGRYGVRANCVAPGVIEAGMFLRLRKKELDGAWQEAALRNIPLRRFGTGGELAHAIVFLASRQASYITGQTLSVDGGYSV